MPTVATDELAALYLDDETAWLDEMKRRIVDGRAEALDLDNLAELLESMASNHRNEVGSRLRILIAHLLKWDYQQEKRSVSWERTILNQRDALEVRLASRTLRAHAVEILPTVYERAARLAMVDTRFDRDAFPAECPWSLEQILGEP